MLQSIAHISRRLLYFYYMKGYMYIVECSDGSYYTGSTNNLELRLQQHQNGDGANHTKNIYL
ncbi:MAG: GIY-YIG nuclease family protein [Bacteroidota bacterium]